MRPLELFSGSGSFGNEFKGDVVSIDVEGTTQRTKSTYSIGIIQSTHRYISTPSGRLHHVYNILERERKRKYRVILKVPISWCNARSTWSITSHLDSGLLRTLGPGCSGSETWFHISLHPKRLVTANMDIHTRRTRWFGRILILS